MHAGRTMTRPSWKTLQGYAANYSSHAKIDRLLFIASASKDASVQLEALRLASDEVKKVCKRRPRGHACCTDDACVLMQQAHANTPQSHLYSDAVN